jgi:hypothetical protein
MILLVSITDPAHLAEHHAHGCIADYHWTQHNGAYFALVHTARADSHACLRSDARLTVFPPPWSQKPLSGRHTGRFRAGELPARATTLDALKVLGSVHAAFDLESD